MMPTTTIASLRAALIWFVIGITVGALMMIDSATGAVGLPSGILHTHIHLLLFGWLVQIIFAVGYWMLPRFGRDRPNAWLAVVAIVGINLACVLSLAFVWVPLHGPVWGVEVLSTLLFVGHAWPRIKGFGAN